MHVRRILRLPEQNFFMECSIPIRNFKFSNAQTGPGNAKKYHSNLDIVIIKHTSHIIRAKSDFTILIKFPLKT